MTTIDTSAKLIKEVGVNVNNVKYELFANISDLRKELDENLVTKSYAKVIVRTSWKPRSNV